jgi:hypothetical protein
VNTIDVFTTIDEATILLEFTELRHKIASTIFCSQIDPNAWHLKLGNETIMFYYNHNRIQGVLDYQAPAT